MSSKDAKIIQVGEDGTVRKMCPVIYCEFIHKTEERVWVGVVGLLNKRLDSPLVGIRSGVEE